MASTSAVAEAIALDQAGGYLFTGTDNGADAQTLIVRRVGADGEGRSGFCRENWGLSRVCAGFPAQ